MKRGKGLGEEKGEGRSKGEGKGRNLGYEGKRKAGSGGGR